VIVLETARIVLRHFEPADLPKLFALYGGPAIRRYFPEGTLTLEQTRQELECFLKGEPRHHDLGLWATVEEATGSFLGHCGLLPWTIGGRPEVELAYMIRKDRWGEGLATEVSRGIVEHARSRLGLRRPICLVMPGNERSAVLARRLGMSFETEYTDEYGPCHVYAMSHEPGHEAIRVAAKPGA
jgi:RimJ/RimL family protein N-acetyltransferase